MASKDMITIYHNPRCGKSRSALTILTEHGIDPVVVEYLKNPPTKDELREILKKLAMKPEQIVRKSEEVCKESHADRKLTDDQWLDALARHPILIERPIVVRGDRAMIGRPPENVLEIL